MAGGRNRRDEARRRREIERGREEARGVAAGDAQRSSGSPSVHSPSSPLLPLSLSKPRKALGGLRQRRRLRGAAKTQQRRRAWWLLRARERGRKGVLGTILGGRINTIANPVHCEVRRAGVAKEPKTAALSHFPRRAQPSFFPVSHASLVPPFCLSIIISLLCPPPPSCVSALSSRLFSPFRL